MTSMANLEMPPSVALRSTRPAPSVAMTRLLSTPCSSAQLMKVKLSFTIASNVLTPGVKTTKRLLQNTAGKHGPRSLVLLLSSRCVQQSKLQPFLLYSGVASSFLNQSNCLRGMSLKVFRAFHSCCLPRCTCNLFRLKTDLWVPARKPKPFFYSRTSSDFEHARDLNLR